MWLKRESGASQKPIEQLGFLESELMDRIWRRGQATVRDLHQECAGRLAYTTVMTTMDRLYKKGMLKRSKVRKAFLYVPALTQQEYQARIAQQLFGLVLQGEQSSNAVLSHFLDAVSDKDIEMLDQLERLLKAKRRALGRRE